MKKIILLAALFAVTFSAKAQIADGSIAPDFTTTDINGVEHNLYDYLDQGYTVILDLSAVWCGPCWSYHHSGALEGVYECYGEPGSDNVIVLMIEGDASTPEATLWGGGNSIGDWVTGTPYPIINDDNIASQYELAYWPTVFRICPSDKTVYELGQAGTAAAKNAVLNETCTPPVRSDDPALTCSHSGGEACAGFESDLSVNLFNSGSTVLTAATITAYVDGAEVASMDWTGSLGLYEEETVVLGTTTILEDTDVEFVITATADEKMDNNDAEAGFVTAPAFELPEGALSTFTVEILTDNYGNETYWEVVDDAGTVMASGGNAGVGLTNIGVGAGSPPADPGAYASNTTYTEEVMLPADGCYDLILTDYWGDGVCCTYGNGYYKFLDSDGNVLIEGGSFGARIDNPFTKSTIVSNEEVLLANKFEAFPNPVQNNLTINFSLIETVRVNIEVVNAIGQVVYLEEAGNLLTGDHNVNINMNRFQSGLYFVNLVTEHGVTTQKVIKQ